MKRQFGIFVAASLLIAATGLIYAPSVLANLSRLLAAPVDVLGTTFTLRPVDQPVTPAVLYEAEKIMADRLDQYQLNGKYKIVVLPNEEQLKVTLPDTGNTPHLINVITRVGQIAFIDGGLQSPPVGQRILLSAQPGDQLPVYPPLFTGRDLNAVVSPQTNPGELFYRISLKTDAAARFHSPNKNYVCLVLDNTVTNCSNMYRWAENALQILPNLGDNAGISLQDLAVFLRSGPLPAPFEVVD